MHPFIVRNVINPLFGGFRSNFKIRKVLKEIERYQWLSPELILEDQWRKVTNLIAIAYQNVPYYRAMFDKYGIKPKDIQSPSDMKKIPILTKKDIQKNLSKMINLQYNKKRLYKSTTSGSTGIPTTFFRTDESWIWNTAITAKTNSWTGCKVGEKVSYIWGRELEITKTNQIWQKFKNKLQNMQFISGLELSQSILQKKIEQIANFQPKLIIGYSTYLYIFAVYLIENNIRNIKPVAVISTANTLLDFQRKTIEKAFDCKVFNRYGSRELGCIASECECHGLHINAENVFIEFIETREDVCGEKIFKLICTSLVNYGMPFIRYEIGDLGIASNEQCKCGRGLPLIQELRGRSHDVLITPSGKIIVGNFFGIIFREYQDIISQFQVVQKAIDNLLVKVILKPNADVTKLEEIRVAIQKFVGHDVNIKIKVVKEIKPSKSGKLQLSVSELSFKL